jgi:hypothetical protein
MKRLLILALVVLPLGACELLPTEPLPIDVQFHAPEYDTCLGVGMTSPCAP